MQDSTRLMPGDVVVLTNAGVRDYLRDLAGRPGKVLATRNMVDDGGPQALVKFRRSRLPKSVPFDALSLVQMTDAEYAKYWSRYALRLLSKRQPHRERGKTQLTASCQCEHRVHFDAAARTTRNNPGHVYLTKFVTDFLSWTKTDYGKFLLCRDCREDCDSPPEPFVGTPEPGDGDPDGAYFRKLDRS